MHYYIDKLVDVIHQLFTDDLGLAIILVVIFSYLILSPLAGIMTSFTVSSEKSKTFRLFFATIFILLDINTYVFYSYFYSLIFYYTSLFFYVYCNYTSWLTTSDYNRGMAVVILGIFLFGFNRLLKKMFLRLSYLKAPFDRQIVYFTESHDEDGSDFINYFWSKPGKKY